MIYAYTYVVHLSLIPHLPAQLHALNLGLSIAFIEDVYRSNRDIVIVKKSGVQCL